jgi:hypothetical protein
MASAPQAETRGHANYHNPEKMDFEVLRVLIDDRENKVNK